MPFDMLHSMHVGTYMGAFICTICKYGQNYTCICSILQVILTTMLKGVSVQDTIMETSNSLT